MHRATAADRDRGDEAGASGHDVRAGLQGHAEGRGRQGAHDEDAALDAGRDPASIRRSVLIGSDDWPVLASPEAFREAVLRYAEVGVTDVVLLHPDHPAEVKVAHGVAAPDIVRRIAEDVLPGLRAELA